MALIEYTLAGKQDKVAIAIERIRNFDPLANGYTDSPYYVAYSGGKDSDALRILFELSGAKYDLVHNHTTVDAPETVRYIQSVPNVQIDYPVNKLTGERTSMWRLIAEQGIPPLATKRYCCQTLKEQGGTGRFVATGVRWAESTRRKKSRGSLEVQASKRTSNLILNADNDESRRMFETCQLKGRRIVNPIIDWTDDDVWAFLKAHGCESNPLYQCGYKRVGCVGCPAASWKGMLQGFMRYPKYKELYIHAFDRMLERRIEKGLDTTWSDGQAVFDWWIREPGTEINSDLPGQMSLDFEGLTESEDV